MLEERIDKAAAYPREDILLSTHARMSVHFYLPPLTTKPMSEACFSDICEAEKVIRQHISAAPLIRSYPLEAELGLESRRRVWLKDYGWTPVGSFKLLGALNWMANNLDRIGDRRFAFRGCP